MARKLEVRKLTVEGEKVDVHELEGQNKLYLFVFRTDDMDEQTLSRAAIKLKEKLKPLHSDGLVFCVSPDDDFELYEVD